MRRLRVGGLAAVLALAVLAVGAWAAFASGGNSDAAHACQQGGYLNLHPTSGPDFTNAGECVSYAAHGGQFQNPLPACTVDPANDVGCLTFNDVTVPLTYGSLTGTTLTLNAVYSFDTSISGSDITLPNAWATGGGTYVIKDGSGSVVEQGTLTAADTAETSEGLVGAAYSDDNNDPATCPAATYRLVRVSASTGNESDPTLSSGAITLTADASRNLVFVTSASGNSWGGTVGSAVTISC